MASHPPSDKVMIRQDRRKTRRNDYAEKLKKTIEDKPNRLVRRSNDNKTNNDVKQPFYNNNGKKNPG
jgi:hypothetical protein